MAGAHHYICHLSLKITSVFQTGLSDCHCLVATTLKAHVPRLKPKQIKYRSYKNFQPDTFLNDVHDLEIQPYEHKILLDDYKVRPELNKHKNI